MKTAYFVESINVKEVPLINMGEMKMGVQYHRFKRIKGTPPCEGLLTEDNVEHVVVPAREFCKLESGSPNWLQDLMRPPVYNRVYIAVSEEVRDYLQLPFDVMDEDIKTLKANLSLSETSHRKVEGQVLRAKNVISNMHSDIEGASFWKKLCYLFNGGKLRVFSENSFL